MYNLRNHHGCTKLFTPYLSLYGPLLISFYLLFLCPSISSKAEVELTLNLNPHPLTVRISSLISYSPSQTIPFPPLRISMKPGPDFPGDKDPTMIPAKSWPSGEPSDVSIPFVHVCLHNPIDTFGSVRDVTVDG